MELKDIDLGFCVKLADNPLQRMKGLLFYKEPITDEGLLITPCNSIHMFFMRFSIDVIFLDRTNKVVKSVPELKPWRMVSPVKYACAALELPAGTIKEKGIRKGDRILL